MLQSKSEDGQRREEITFDNWINSWKSVYLPHTVKPSTLQFYTSLVKHIPEKLKRKKLSEITTIDLQEMLNHLSDRGGVDCQGLSPKTVRSLRTTIISCLECAVDNQFLTKNPCKKTKPPRLVQKQIIFLTPEQAAKLQEVADSGSYYYDIQAALARKNGEDTSYLVAMMGMLIRLAFATGMRRGELFGLLWANVDLDDQVIHVENGVNHGKIAETKTVNSIRIISIDDDTASRLKQFKECQEQYKEAVGDQYHDTGLVFANSYGYVMNFDTFRSRYFSRMCKKAGMPEGFTLHSIRHTHATMLLEGGINPNVISKRLGHSSVAFTMQVYAHVTQQMERGAADTIGAILSNKKE